MIATERPNKVGRPKEFDKEQVLAKAVDAFSNKGYEATTVQDLVDAMGINRFSLYEEFGGKYELFLSALDFYHLARRQRVVNHFSTDKPTKELLREYLKMIYCDARNGGAYGCIMVNSACELAREDRKIAQRISDHFEKLEEIFIGVLAIGRERGEVGCSQDLRALARFLLNVSRGLRVMVTYERDQEVFDDISSLALSLVDR